MKAAVMREYGKPLTIEDIEIGKPQVGEVKVKISAVGLCHTDISVFHGGFPPPLPVVLGHEGVGVVEEVGVGVTRLIPGDLFRETMLSIVYGKFPQMAVWILPSKQ